jgi:RNA polymerase sigma-54 factor
LANNLELSLVQSPKLVLNPLMYQALEVMQLPLPELINYINNELAENPLLEVSEDYYHDYERPYDEENSTGVDILRSPGLEGEEEVTDSWLERVVKGVLTDEDLGRERSNWASYPNPESEYVPQEGQWFDNKSLEEYLMEQLRFVKHTHKLSEEEFKTAQYLIGNLDSKGYLTVSLEEIAVNLKLQLEKVARALQIVQQLDPLGVGARDLAECLKLQFPLLPHCPPKMELLLNHLDFLASGYYKKISLELNISVQEVKAMAELLKLLDPKPGSHFDSNTRTKYIIPDAVIKKIDNEYYVLVNESNVPKLYINEKYRRALREQKDQKFTEFITEKIQAGLNLIKCIENRRRTIHDVLKKVIEKQKEFLDQGVSALKPLTMREVAEELGIHESTVSRVSSNKYIETPRGVFPIKCFFVSSIDGKSEITAEKVKEELKKVIAEEDPDKPYSDQMLVSIFAESGIEIARRTIAKYRKELGIPSSHLRKQVQKI